MQNINNGICLPFFSVFILGFETTIFSRRMRSKRGDRWKKLTKCWRTLMKSMGTPASSARPLFRNRSYATSGLVLGHWNFFNCKILLFSVIGSERINNTGIYSTQIASTEQAQLRTRKIKNINSNDIKWCQMIYPGHQDTHFTDMAHSEPDKL
jgi:hypothetical protein